MRGIVLTLLRAAQVVAANQSHVPPIGRGSLYLRPLLLGTGPILGLGASIIWPICCQFQPKQHAKLRLAHASKP